MMFVMQLRKQSYHPATGTTGVAEMLAFDRYTVQRIK
jgi:hypothetical protein